MNECKSPALDANGAQGDDCCLMIHMQFAALECDTFTRWWFPKIEDEFLRREILQLQHSNRFNFIYKCEKEKIENVAKVLLAARNESIWC